MRKKRGMLTALAVSFVLGAAGCQGPAPESEPAGETGPVSEPAPRRAVASLQALGDSGVTGTVTFTETDAGIEIEAHVNGLTPGAHGFHVHERGDCSAPDGTSAGGHFAPSGQPHGAPGPASHAGDYGNIEADESGHGMLLTTANWITFDRGPNAVAGRAVIVHAGADDLTTQPTGNAGGRVACGVIVVEGEETSPVLPPVAE